MKGNVWIRRAAFAGLLIVPLLTAGCTLFKSDGEKGEIDPPPANVNMNVDLGVDMKANQLDMMTGADAAQDRTEVTLYFKDSSGYVAPVGLKVPSTAAIAQRSLEYMVQGGPETDMLPAGFSALLPAGTEVLGINLIQDQRLAIVDFSKSFANYKAEDERKILEAVTWTLTGFPSIDTVQIKMEGRALKEMPVDGTPLDDPLSRNMGINLEMGSGVALNQASPVTLYFLSQNQDEFQYFVPVTRLIQRTDRVAEATVEQLIKGPQTPSALHQVIDSSAKVVAVNVSDDQSMVTVDFDDSLLGPDQKAPPEALQAVVLSLTESAKDAKVQITVDGGSKVFSSDDVNYSLPVTRPVHVNTFAS